MTWQPITYDPELNLIYVTTGNPQPVIAHKNRAGRQPLHRLDRRAQPRHRQDGLVLPVVAARHARLGLDADAGVFDGEFNGQPRKLLAQAARNGHFFLLDRATGKALVSSEYVKTNWAKGYDAKGQPIPNPAKDPQIDGALVSPNQGGATNWPPPSFSPQTGLFYVSAGAGLQRVLHLRPERQPARLGRHRSRRLVRVDAAGDRLQDRQGPLEPQVGRQHPRRRAEHRRQCASSPAARSSDLVALNATTGDALWQARLNSVASATARSPTSSTACSTCSSGRATRLWTFVMNQSRQ